MQANRCELRFDVQGGGAREVRTARKTVAKSRITFGTIHRLHARNGKLLDRGILFDYSFVAKCVFMCKSKYSEIINFELNIGVFKLVLNQS